MTTETAYIGQSYEQGHLTVGTLAGECQGLVSDPPPRIEVASFGESVPFVPSAGDTSGKLAGAMKPEGWFGSKPKRYQPSGP
jgi:hypothetical protein